MKNIVVIKAQVMQIYLVDKFRSLCHN